MTVVLAPPIAGDWLVLHPPGHPPEAYDLVGVDATTGRITSRPGWQFFAGLTRAQDFHGWDRPVRAPADGCVVSVAADVPDRHRLVPLIDVGRLVVTSLLRGRRLEAMAGNHVLLEADGAHVLVAHLRRGSVGVRTGDHVTAGQLIGHVGNSGASLAPHVHLQVTAGADVMTHTPIPFAVTYRERVGRDFGPPEAAQLPRQRRRVRFASPSDGPPPASSPEG